MTGDVPVRNRVQIVPLGFEYARLREPILYWKADVVVAIEYAESEQEIPFLSALLDELEQNERIELERRECDLFELYDALGTITKAITDYETDDVYVNLSAGSKITAIAGMIACMASGASPIYARPDYGPDGEQIPDEPLHDGVAEVFALPTYPIDRPSNTHVAFLARIEAGTTPETHGRYHGVPKKELIEFALEEEFDFVVRSETTSQKGYYRLLDRHVIEPLVERGYVEIEQVGRRKFVSLTPDGENVLRAFRHFIE
ncbi:DUF6293 family protein [Natrononativus amylolyticus]|uniref:HFX_2341 family transcriptional regulator domain-containing protein n=1 Tax=Natrononativus amylolyticus TaxID=2963434 RepID=UPI0020CBE399|nr:DUF6293 family protein [Natrononativus amylolyticus]